MLFLDSAIVSGPSIGRLGLSRPLFIVFSPGMGPVRACLDGTSAIVLQRERRRRHWINTGDTISSYNIWSTNMKLLLTYFLLLAGATATSVLAASGQSDMSKLSTGELAASQVSKLRFNLRKMGLTQEQECRMFASQVSKLLGNGGDDGAQIKQQPDQQLHIRVLADLAKQLEGRPLCKAFGAGNPICTYVNDCLKLLGPAGGPLLADNNDEPEIDSSVAGNLTNPTSLGQQQQEEPVDHLDTARDSWADNEQLRIRVEELETAQRELTDELHRGQENVERLEAQTVELRSALDKAEMLLAANEADLRTCRADLDNVSDQRRADVTKGGAELEECRTSLDRIEKAHEIQTQELATCRSHLNELTDTGADSVTEAQENELKAVRERIDNLKNDLQQGDEI